MKLTMDHLMSRSADDRFDEIDEGRIEAGASATDVLVAAAFDEPSSYVIEAIRLLGMLPV